MKSLMDIEDFGGTAAEEDDIKKFFLKTEAFEKIVAGKRHVVIGRKGSGKTALYLAVKDHAETQRQLVSGLRFSDYPWQAHYSFSNPTVDKAERFVESWRFLILVEALSQIVSVSDSPRRIVGEVKDFFKENYGTLDLSFRDVFKQKKFSFKGASISPEIAGNSLGSIDGEMVAGSGLGDSLVRVNKWLWDRLKQIPGHPTCYVLFDELDMGWDPSNPTYKDRLIGLLVAVRRFVASCREESVDVRPIVFLRSDIFESLSFGDKNKIWTSSTEELLWHDRLDYGGASLKHLIDFRIRESLGIAAGVSDPWGEVFDDQVMAGTQHKFQHMTFRSFLRPRDVIMFCNLSLHAYQNRDRYAVGAEKSGRIENQDIKSARKEYSTYFRRELDDEISEARPNWQDGLEVLRIVGHSKFTLEEFQRAYQKMTSGRNVEYSSEEILNILYDYSIIGFLRKSLEGSGMADHFRYQDESINFDIGARRFAVHRGLKESLGLSQMPGAEDSDEDTLF